MHSPNPVVSRIHRAGSVFCLAVLGVLVCAATTVACPFCAPTDTLANQIFLVDATVVVKRVAGEEGQDGQPGTTTVRIERVLHISTALAKAFVVDQSADAKLGAMPPVVGDEIMIRRYYPPKEGAKYLLRGADPENLVWGDNMIEVDDEVIKYVMDAPPVDAPATKRGDYYLALLENKNQEIAQDAYAEFASMPYEDVASFRDRMPREKLRKWIFDEQIPGTRLGLYGLMLGLCGDDTDAALLEKKIRERASDFRLGIDGVMGGYLLLTGDRGLDFLETEVLKNKDIPSGELLAAMQAMRFMWTYGDGRVSKPRLRAAMRLLIDHPQHIDMAIRDLARWDDWDDMDRVVGLYGTTDYDDLTARVAIIKYVLAAINRKPTDDESGLQEKARRHLADLRKKDPKIVQRAERFFDIR